MTKKKSPGRGGAREGAGRKVTNPEGRTMVMAASVPEALMKRLDALAKSKGWSKSQAVTVAIRGLLTRSKSRS